MLLQLGDKMSSIQSELADVMPELAGAIPDNNDETLVQLESQNKIVSQEKLFNDISSTLNGSNDFLSFLKESKEEETKVSNLA